jgi:hypothetical protein
MHIAEYVSAYDVKKILIDLGFNGIWIDKIE